MLKSLCGKYDFCYFYFLIYIDLQNLKYRVGTYLVINYNDKNNSME